MLLDATIIRTEEIVFLAQVSATYLQIQLLVTWAFSFPCDPNVVVGYKIAFLQESFHSE